MIDDRPWFLVAAVLVWTVGLAAGRGGGVWGRQYPLIPWEDLWKEADQMTEGRKHCNPDHSQCWPDPPRTSSPLPRHPPHSTMYLCSQCHCDAECVEFGDCCRDRAQADWGDGREEASGRYSCRKTHSLGLVGLLMVDSCPPEQDDTPMQRLCSQQVPRESYTYLLDLPVTSRTTNITYVNHHCAACNGDAGDLHKFNITINCKTQQMRKEYSMVDFMRKAQYVPGQRQFRRVVYRDEDDERQGIPRETHHCTLEIEEFDDPDEFVERYGGRVCLYPKSTCIPRFVGRRPMCYELVRHCDPSWPDHLDIEKCHRYSQVMQVDVEGHRTLYKNPHCARCNFVNISAPSFQCKPHSATCQKGIKSVFNLPPSFSVLMDFHQDSCYGRDELWDPIHQSCKKIYCGKLFKLHNGRCIRDPDAYALLENSTLLDDSCPKVMLTASEYIPLGNRSVLVNGTGRLYDEGEYEVLSGETIYICNEHDWYFTQLTTDIHELLTLVTLVISLVGLGLHIIIFILVPRHRNLPGKNLFSLSCCLFLAHLIFLTGTHATANKGFCIFLSAVLHFFWLAAFCWMNVMSVDVCRTFTGQMHHGDATSHRKYIFYSIYAWTVPTLVVALALVFEYVDLLPDYQVDYGTKICYINNRYGLALFFLLPQGAIVLENTILFIMTACGIYKQAKAARYANIRTQSQKGWNVKMQGRQPLTTQPAQVTRRRKERVRLLLYVKLGVIQGVSWLTGFLAAFAGWHGCWFAFTIFNGLQGAFIFVAFDLKIKVWESVWEAVTGRTWKKGQSSKDTRTTTAARTVNSASHNRSSKSCSDSDGESKDGSRSETVWRERCDGARGREGEGGATWQSASNKNNPTWKNSPKTNSAPRTQNRHVASGKGVRNGDLRASVVRGKFQDENTQETGKTKPQPDLQRILDLLQKLQQTRNSVDLPDLVQQLLLRTGGPGGRSRSQTRTLGKCKSFSEGTDPQRQEDQRMALSARLQLLEYWRECPTIHSLISTHGQPMLPAPPYPAPPRPVQSPSTPHRHHQLHLKRPMSAVSTQSASHHQHHNKSRVRNTDEPMRSQHRPKLPKSQSYTQMSQVALAAAMVQKARAEERRGVRERAESKASCAGSESLV